MLAKGVYWDLYIYSTKICAITKTTKVDHSSGHKSMCIDVDYAINDNVSSVVFTTSDGWSISPFADAGCSGEDGGALLFSSIRM